MNDFARLSIDLSQDTDKRISALALALDRSKSSLIEQAIADYLVVHDWQVKAINEGIAAADDNRIAGHDDIVAWVQSWDGPNELPTPSCK